MDVTIAQAERLLNTEYFIFRHVQSGPKIARATSYSLPLYLHDHIDVVQPTDSFSSVQALLSGVRVETDTLATSGASSTPNIGLQQVKYLYGTTGYTPPIVSASKYALTG